MIRSVSTPSSQIRLEFEAFRVTSHELLRRRLRREDSLLDWKLVLVEKTGETSVVLARGRGEDAMIEHDDSNNRRRYVVATLLPNEDDRKISSKKMEIWIRSCNKKDRVRLGHAAIWFDHVVSYRCRSYHRSLVQFEHHTYRARFNRYSNFTTALKILLVCFAVLLWKTRRTHDIWKNVMRPHPSTTAISIRVDFCPYLSSFSCCSTISRRPTICVGVKNSTRTCVCL